MRLNFESLFDVQIKSFDIENQNYQEMRNDLAIYFHRLS